MKYRIDIPFARFPLAAKPTPLHPLANLGAALDIRMPYVKRDDLTGLAFGGNKARQLEWYFGQAAEKNADTVLITGAVQSNYVRMAAAAANLAGMECHIQLEDRVKEMPDLYHTNGNAFLNRLLGAKVHLFPDGENENAADRKLEEIASQLKFDGKNPYIIYLGPGRPPLGALGYVEAAAEILTQAETMNIKLGSIIVPSGTSYTHAGLLVGLRSLNSRIPVYGICVRRDADSQAKRVLETCRALEKMLDMKHLVAITDVLTSDRHLAGGYGRIDSQTIEALTVTAKTEGLCLDPVYTGKSMAGLFSMAREGSLNEATTVYWHTGGTPALFAYQDSLAEVIDKKL